MLRRWTAPARITLAILATNVIFIALCGVLIGLGLFDDLRTDYVLMQIMALLFGVLGTLLVLWLFRTLDRTSPWLLGFRMTKKDGLFGVAAVVLSFLAVLLFIVTLDRLGVVTAQYAFDRLGSGAFYELLGLAAVGYFFAALKEEVLARGYFMANLARLGVPAAIVVSAALFMALHFVMGDLDPFKAASWFKGGLVYAYIYVKSGSLTVATIVHAAHNLVNDLVIHGSDGALVFLSAKVSTADKLVYELALGTLLFGLTYLFYGKNGWLTPADNLKRLWGGTK
ncbi:CPBP family intramembrane metalloprotease [Paenibacillus sp. TRM 82003]|nr:CPBP family intramembrane metalloprotease [Paenibacillus sp. TRM 82003]